MRYILAIAALLGASWLYSSSKPKAREPAAAKAPTHAPSAAQLPVANGPTQTSPAIAASSEPKDDALKSISALQKCYESQSCSFPNTDPKSYEIAVGQALSSQLRAFLKQARGRQDMQGDLYDLAKTHIHSMDGFVQSAALEIMAELPPDAELLRALGEGVELTTDPSIVEMAMQEMKRYLGTGDEPIVHKTLQAVITDGSHFSSQAAAQGILPFINDRSFTNYSKTSSALPSDSATGRLLNSALQEYERHTTGG